MKIILIKYTFKYRKLTSWPFKLDEIELLRAKPGLTGYCN